MKARNVVLVTGAIAAVSIVGILAVSQHKPVPAPQAVSKPNITGLWRDINNERIKAGEKPLVLDEKLNASAAAKCADMVAHNYHDHVSPTGVRYDSFIQQQVGTNYVLSGENLAEGYNTSDSVTNAWLHSPTHKENLLRPQFTKVGYAVCHDANLRDYGDTEIVVQHFTQI